MAWQAELNLPTDLFDGEWPSPETVEFWEVAYFDQEVEGILTDQVPKLFTKSLEVQKALATCSIWINSMATVVDDNAIREALKNPCLLSSSSISLIFHDPMTDYVLEQIGIAPPSSSESFHSYLEKQSDIKKGLKSLSPEMKDVAWWAFWGTFDSAGQKSTSEFSINRPEALGKKEVVSFMQNKLGLKPPKLIKK